MSLPVGIHENVKMSFRTSEVNGQSVLNVVLEQIKPDDSLFDGFSDATTEGSNGGDTTQITSWPLKVKGLEGGKLVDDRSVASVVGDFKDKKAYYTSLLEAVGVDKNQIEWNPFRNLDINLDTIKANPNSFKDDDVLGQVSKNMNEQVVEFAKAFADPTKLLRVPLVRTSKKDHRPKLRDRYLDKNVLAESMDVPASESKVGFTPGEIKAGLDNPNPVEADGTTPSGTEGLPFDGGQVKDPAGVPEGL